MIKASQRFSKNSTARTSCRFIIPYFYFSPENAGSGCRPAGAGPVLRQWAVRTNSYAAVRFRAASASGRYLALSFIQCSARLLALAISLSGKVTNGTRVGPTLQ
jgi:hypothetical protein